MQIIIVDPVKGDVTLPSDFDDGVIRALQEPFAVVVDRSSLGKLGVRVAVLNVFDHSFELRDGSGIGVGAPQFGPRRTIYAGFTKSF